MNVETLIHCGIGPTQAKAFAGPLQAAMQRFAITSSDQRAGFIAQCSHESAAFAHLEESLWYSTTANIMAAFARLRALPPYELDRLVRNPKGLAVAAYADRNGNRPGTTDAWNYRGSGLLGLTGRENFMAAEKALGRPYAAEPDRVRSVPEDAVLTAAWYWCIRGCNQAMAERDFEGTSRIINLGSRQARGVPNGAEDRKHKYVQCLFAMGDVA